MLNCCAWLSESVGYRFGVSGDSSSGGLLTFSHPESSWTDTRRDQIAFGFRTGQANAVLISLASGTSTDYIDVELVRIREREKKTLCFLKEVFSFWRFSGFVKVLVYNKNRTQ